jgi:transitional endoplasmic reticulum ATPase
MALAPDVDLAELARRTEGYSGADIAEVCRKAGRIALRENPEAQVVAMRHFLEALEKTPPSVSPEERVRYDKLAKNLRRAVRRLAGFMVEEEEAKEEK